MLTVLSASLPLESHLVFYIPSSVRIFEGVKGFHEVSVGGADASYHQCPGVSTKRILQEPG